MGYGSPRLGRLRDASVTCALGLLFAAILVASGCGLVGGQQNKKATAKPAITGTVKISGSGTCIPLLKVLQPDFNKLHPEVHLVFLPGVHSSGGIKGAASGVLDVGAVSRELKPDEKKYHLLYRRLSDDALGVAACRGAGVTAVTTRQLKAVYQRKITDWKQLGGKSGPITVLDRNEDESAKIIFRRHVLGPELKVFSQAVRLYHESDMVEGLVNTPGAIGYLSYGFSQSEHLPIQILAVDGVKPSVANVSDDSYKMVRGLGVVTKKKPPAAAKTLMDYLASKRAAAVMVKYGYAPCRRR